MNDEVKSEKVRGQSENVAGQSAAGLTFTENVPSKSKDDEEKSENDEVEGENGRAKSGNDGVKSEKVEVESANDVASSANERTFARVAARCIRSTAWLYRQFAPLCTPRKQA